ncbi:MAG: HD domain-containing protein [Haloechinothrix sp.]
MGLVHGLPEIRIGDVPSVGKRYVATTPAAEVGAEQTADCHLPLLSGSSPSSPSMTSEATLEARCSRDADKIECVLQAREYQREGYTDLDRWVSNMVDAVTTLRSYACESSAGGRDGASNGSFSVPQAAVVNATAAVPGHPRPPGSTTWTACQME